MNIRAAEPADIPAIVKIERSCDTAAHWSEAEYANMFVDDAVPRLALVADEALIAGFIVVRSAGPEWEIENVAVAPDHRGRGIGLLLVQAVIARAISQDVRQIHLEVRASNHAARRLYQRAGFHEIGVRAGYYDKPVEEAVQYRWEWLSSAP